MLMAPIGGRDGGQFIMKQYYSNKIGRIKRKAENEGESLEEFLRRQTETNEPIQATAKIQYTERKDGVLPEYDIRTDRFEYAMRAMDKVHATNAAQRHAADFPEENKDKPSTPPMGEA